jgi:non-homologous end joining protein Ku
MSNSERKEMKPFLNITGKINSKSIYEVGGSYYLTYEDAVKAVEKGEAEVIVIDGEEFGVINAIGNKERAKNTMIKGKSCGIAWNKVKE